MLLEYDKIAQVKEIAREIAKEEIEAIGKGSGAIVKKLEAVITDLETRVNALEAKSAKLKELAEELGRQIKNLKPEKPKESEKPAGKGFLKK